ncbi:MAG: radical SAM family heme chaperone HemW [Huintestinicola sp.]
MSVGLYIHVPFCRRKCLYCDFYSAPSDSDAIKGYVRAVIRNIRSVSYKYDTVYFGGGTPSLLEAEQLARILENADIESSAEISMECNPDSADFFKLSEYRKAGINRISFGVQSFDDNELKMLGRLHDAAAARKAIENAAKAGFDNISADLMLGLPYQKYETISRNIGILSDLPVNHISAYMLKIEEGTPLAMNSELVKAAADDEDSADYYEAAVNQLDEEGFHQYEISNFARIGRECRHNLKYWKCEDYYGIGPSAHSCMNSVRFAVPADTSTFISSDVQNNVITDDNACTEEERMMLALRLSVGFDILQSGFSDEAKKAIICESENLSGLGLMKYKNGKLSLTPKGFLVSNEIICRMEELAEKYKCSAN